MESGGRTHASLIAAGRARVTEWDRAPGFDFCWQPRRQDVGDEEWGGWRPWHGLLRSGPSGVDFTGWGLGGHGGNAS